MQQSSKSNAHKLLQIQELPKKVPKLHLYCNILPRKANPTNSNFPTTNKSKPKARKHELLQIDACLAHQHMHELQHQHPKTTML
jgi:hypothetical protein